MKTILIIALLCITNSSWAAIRVKSNLGQTIKEHFIKEANRKGSFVNRAIPSAKSEGIEKEYGEYFGPESKDIKASDLQLLVTRTYVGGWADDTEKCRLLTLNTKPSQCEQFMSILIVLSQKQGDPGGNSFYSELKTTIFEVEVRTVTATPGMDDYNGEIEVSKLRLVRP